MAWPLLTTVFQKVILANIQQYWSSFKISALRCRSQKQTKEAFHGNFKSHSSKKMQKRKKKYILKLNMIFFVKKKKINKYVSSLE